MMSTRNNWRFLAGVALVCTVSWAFGFTEARSTETRLDLDDIMKIEDLAAVQFDPTGQWVVYEKLRPYGEYSDYSFRTYAMQKSGHQLWRLNVNRPNTPELLPGIDPEPSTYIEGFSPNGRYLTIMQYHFGDLSIGAYDMLRERVAFFDETPDFAQTGEFRPIWISDEEFVFAALPIGAQPAAVSVRAHTGDALYKAWGQAWRGTSATASEVVSTQRDHSNDPAPGRLIKANARTGASEVLAEGRFADLRLAPTGRILAALKQSLPQPRNANRQSGDWINRHNSLVLINLSTGAIQQIDLPVNIFHYSLAWNVTGQHIAFYAWQREDGPRQGRFHVLNVETGEVSEYAHNGLDLASERERGYVQRPERVVFLDDKLVVFARKIPSAEDQIPRFTYRDVRPVGANRADWFLLSVDGSSVNLTKGLSGVSPIPLHAGLGHMTVAATDGVYRLHADGRMNRVTPKMDGAFQYVSAGAFTARAYLIRSEFSDNGLFSVRDGDNTRLVMTDFRDGKEGAAVTIDSPLKNASPLASSLAANAVLFRAEDGNASQLLLSRANEEMRTIVQLNDHLNDLSLGEWRPVEYSVTDPEGLEAPQDITSCILLPPDYVEGERYPLVVEVYPNVGSSFCMGVGPALNRPDPTSPYLFAARGFIYSRLTTPRSLIRMEEGPIAGIDEMMTQGVDALVSQGYVDPDRVALFGASQGGFSSLYVATQTDRFKAVISMNGWANLFSHYFGGHGVYSYLYTDEVPFGSMEQYGAIVGSNFSIGRTAFDDPDMYIRNSPVFLARSINAPILMVHSDMDGFAMAQYDEMFGALRWLGKEARYVRYWGEGHVISSPANIQDMWERFDDFLTRHMQ